MTNSPPRPVRQTLLYGAASGLLAGLAAVAISGREGESAIILWRNVILSGAVLGFVAGLVRAAMHWRQRRDDAEATQPPPDARDRPPS